MAAAHREQAAYRAIGRHPEWDATIRPRIPAELIDVYDRNVDARRQLQAMAHVRDTLPAWRIEQPIPADELMSYYHAGGVGIRRRLELSGRDQLRRDPLRQHRRREHRRRARPHAVLAVDVRLLRPGRRYQFAARQHHGGGPLPRRQWLRQRSRSRDLRVQPCARIRAGGRRLRRLDRQPIPLRSPHYHRWDVYYSPPRATCYSRLVTPRGRRSRSAITWRPTRSNYRLRDRKSCMWCCGSPVRKARPNCSTLSSIAP